MIFGAFFPAGRTASTARIRTSALAWVGFAYVRGGVAFMFSIVVMCDRVSTGRGVVGDNDGCIFTVLESCFWNESGQLFFMSEFPPA